MNAIPNIELPGLDEVLKAEITIVDGDCARIATQHAETVSALATNRERQARLMRELRALREAEATLSTRAGTLKRVLTARRRVLLDMQEELS